MTATTRTRTDADIAAAFARQEELLKAEVAELNALLGLTDADHSRKVTVGYIGNGKLGANGWDLSDCRWSVYLPHPGRVGTSDDCIGYWATGSLEGVVAARRELMAFVKGVKFARSV
ncbi:hypothetical protein PBI_THONKO_20 [Mycobacterium phage Thonko]|uniref:Uncharacterized protein n=1 Tax=Mycobacterium phage Thonko TaxID=2282910 RepID=A0A346FC67_9CAUD|nr:hypothetical protein I5G57_gp020 [Mycobacterium phage Thonko]AXN53292.1 hypothetical protein PBI_THONKO_20 [Mycobacterium phage Thonko]